MSKIHIKMLSEDALMYLKNNSAQVAKKVADNPTNSWISSEFPQPMFIEKKFEIEDFELKSNPELADKDIDFSNSVKIYEHLKCLPRYILSDERFWLWLYFDNFYEVVRTMMKVNGKSTIENMWMHTQGTRRGLMFGVLSRCYFRVVLSIDNSKRDKYELTRWVIENPERFRNLTWRSFSSEEHLVRGALKGEKRAVEEKPELEKNDIYAKIGKYVSVIGSVRLLDVISEEDISQMIYEKMLELMQEVVD